MLLVMLPGAGIDATEFLDRGMIAAVQEHGLAVDIVAAHPDPDLYFNGDVAAALHRDVVEPALAKGYARIWIVGISLGGMGAILYSSVYAVHVEGLVLLAPFLGTRGTIAEIAEAGGLTSWRASDSTSTTMEIRMLTWLQDLLTVQPERPSIYLGYGETDRFVLGHKLLAARLPEERVVQEPGGHDWNTWLTLWQRILDTSPFTARSGDGP